MWCQAQSVNLLASPPRLLTHSHSPSSYVSVCVCDHVRKEKTEDPPNPLDGGENSLPAHKDGRLGTHSFFGGEEEGHA